MKTEKTFLEVFHCGPQSDKCKCDCTKNPPGECEHKWDGEWKDVGSGGHSVTCSRCGMPAMSHDAWLFW